MLLGIDDNSMETVYLANLIKRAVTGPMWHGAALNELLTGVTSEQAAARPIPGAHSIWEIVLHVTAWAEIARARIHGERLLEPPTEQDWPPVRGTSASDWSAAVDRLRESYRTLAHDVRHLEDIHLHEKIQGLDYSASNLLHGVVEHGTYHGGQIALLKKATAPAGR